MRLITVPASTRPSHLLDLLENAQHALLIFKDDLHYGERVLATSTLRREAALIARGLSERGVRPGDRVTILLSQSHHTLYLFWACVMLGAIPLVAPMEHHLLSELIPTLSDEVVVMDQILEQTSRSLFPSSFELLNLSTLKASTPIDSWHRSSSPHRIAMRSVSFDRMTGPHLHELSHHNVLSTLVQHVTATHINARSILVNWMPPSSFSSLCAGHFAALLQNAGHIMISPYTFPDDPLLWLHTLHQHRATHAIATRAITSLIYHHISPSALNDLDLSSLVSIWLGPEPLSSRDTYEFCHLLGRAYVKPQIMQTGFGLDQGSLCASISSMEDSLSLLHLERGALAQGRIELTNSGSHAVPLLSMGKPVIGCSIRIVNERGDTLPELRLGEVTLSGPGVPTGEENHWYHTETIGFISQGNLYTLGQVQDRYTTSKGHTLYAMDIEASLEHHFFSLDGPVAAIAYETIEKERHILVCVCCRLHGEELREELARMRVHIEETFPEGCADIEDLSLLPILTADYPHTSTHQLWRQGFRNMLAQGQLDLVLAEAGIPLPSHARPRITQPSHAIPQPLEEPVSTDTTHTFIARLSPEQCAMLHALLDIHQGELVLALAHDEQGHVTQIEQLLERGEDSAATFHDEDLTIETALPDFEPPPTQEPHLKATLLTLPEPPLTARPDEETGYINLEPIEVSQQEALDSSFESLEEETQQLWLHDRPEHDDAAQPPYKSVYPTQQMVGLEPQNLVPASQIQAPFLMEFVPPDIGWVELMLELPTDTTEEALHRAIRALSMQHDTLRTHFIAMEGGESLQHIQPGLTTPLDFHDISQLDTTSHHARRSQIMARFRALKRESRHHHSLIHWLGLRDVGHTSLHLLVHHIVLDERAAHDVLGLLRAKLEDPTLEFASASATPGELAAHIASQHQALGAHQYWRTLFARPYPHLSLRDATFPTERCTVSAVLEQLAPRDDAQVELSARVLAAYARWITGLTPGERPDELIISTPHDWTPKAHRSSRPLCCLTSPLPIRLDMVSSDESLDLLAEHARERRRDAQRHALCPDAIAKAANISTLIASGTRFAFRWRAHDTLSSRHIRHHDPLVAYTSPFLNELFLDCVTQPGGDVLVTLYVGEDVQLGQPAIDGLNELLEALRGR